MAFGEVSWCWFERSRRLWLASHSYRSIAPLALVDCKSGLCYLAAAEAADLDWEGDEARLTDELPAEVVASVSRGRRPGRRGPT